jgi:hypothetical protein
LLIYVTNHTQYHIGRENKKKIYEYHFFVVFGRETHKHTQKKKKKQSTNKNMHADKDVRVENKWIKNNICDNQAYVCICDVNKGRQRNVEKKNKI